MDKAVTVVRLPVLRGGTSGQRTRATQSQQALTISTPSAKRESMCLRVSDMTRSAVASSLNSKDGVSIKLSPSCWGLPVPSMSTSISIDAVLI